MSGQFIPAEKVEKTKIKLIKTDKKVEVYQPEDDENAILMKVNNTDKAPDKQDNSFIRIEGVSLKDHEKKINSMLRTLNGENEGHSNSAKKEFTAKQEKAISKLYQPPKTVIDRSVLKHELEKARKKANLAPETEAKIDAMIKEQIYSKFGAKIENKNIEDILNEPIFELKLNPEILPKVKVEVKNEPKIEAKNQPKTKSSDSKPLPPDQLKKIQQTYDVSTAEMLELQKKKKSLEDQLAKMKENPDDAKSFFTTGILQMAVDNAQDIDYIVPNDNPNYLKEKEEREAKEGKKENKKEAKETKKEAKEIKKETKESPEDPKTSTTTITIIKRTNQPEISDEKLIFDSFNASPLSIEALKEEKCVDLNEEKEKPGLSGCEMQ